MKLTDTQAIILNKAAQHPLGLCAVPAIPPAPRAQIARKLAYEGLVEDIALSRLDTASAGFIWRADGEDLGLRITAAGLEAIGVDPVEWPEHCRPQPSAPAEAATAPAGDGAEEAGEPAAEAAAPMTSVPTRGKRKAAEEAAARGEMPQPPDFSADTHKPYRAKLAKLVAMAEAGDIDGLKGMPINPTSTSPKALARWRDLAVMALAARR
jgi:hypothetical protein